MGVAAKPYPNEIDSMNKSYFGCEKMERSGLQPFVLIICPVPGPLALAIRTDGPLGRQQD